MSDLRVIIHLFSKSTVLLNSDSFSPRIIVASLISNQIPEGPHIATYSVAQADQVPSYVTPKHRQSVFLRSNFLKTHTLHISIQIVIDHVALKNTTVNELSASDIVADGLV